MDYYSYYYYQFIFCWLWKSYSTNKLINSCINIATETTPHSLSNDINHVKKFFFLSGFSSTRSRTFRHLFATLHVRLLSHFWSHRLYLPDCYSMRCMYHLIELLFDWLMMWCWLLFVCLLIWYNYLYFLLSYRACNTA